MPATCCLCSSNITNGRFPDVKCGGVCEQLFHIKCVDISDDLLKGIRDRSANWLCTGCRDASSVSIIDHDVNELECNVSNSDIMQQLKIMERKLSTFDELKNKICNLEDNNASLTTRVHKLEEQLSKLNYNLNVMEAENDRPNQVNIANCITISGLPMKHGDIRGVIVNTIQKLDLNIEPDDIITVEEVHRHVKTTQMNKRNANNIFQDFFIVKLKSKELKYNILAQMRKKKVLTTKDLDVFLPQNHPEQRIFVFHQFTKFQSKLYSEAKNLKVKYNYKFLWVKTGQIYLRKTADSEIHRIHSWNDILTLRNNDVGQVPVDDHNSS